MLQRSVTIYFRMSSTVLLVFSFSGRTISITLGLLNAVVSIKKVSSRQARSTIGVMSMCVLCLFDRRFPFCFTAFVLNYFSHFSMSLKIIQRNINTFKVRGEIEFVDIVILQYIDHLLYLLYNPHRGRL